MMQIDIDLSNLFDEHKLPEEVKGVMRGMRGSFDQYGQGQRHGHGHGHFHNQEPQEHMPRGHHGPMVKSTRGHGHREHTKA